MRRCSIGSHPRRSRRDDAVRRGPAERAALREQRAELGGPLDDDVGAAQLVAVADAPGDADHAQAAGARGLDVVVAVADDDGVARAERPLRARDGLAPSAPRAPAR